MVKLFITGSGSPIFSKEASYTVITRVRHAIKPQVAFLFAVLLLMSIHQGGPCTNLLFRFKEIETDCKSLTDTNDWVS